MIYLNYSDGRKIKQLENTSIKNYTKNFQDFCFLLKRLLHLGKNDSLSFSQNLTTSLIFSLKPILEKSDYNIFISNHEIKWFKTLFGTGKLPVRETTYPNYVKQKSVPFIKKDVTLFNPEVNLENIEKVIRKKPAIIIISHVSRMTGERFVNEKLYREIKKINPHNILIVDGSQSVGILSVNPKKISDIYLGVTSKFINAEPHIGFCYISKSLRKKYNMDQWSIDPKEFSREIYSTLVNIKKVIINSKILRQKRNYLEKLIKENDLTVYKTQNQVDYIVTIPWKRNIEKVINNLKEYNIHVFHNKKYSITEPKNPGIRISFTSKTKITDFKKLVQKLIEIKKSKT